MKCKALFFTLVFPAFLCAQNLVPNWSFEEYEDCPDGSAQIERASGWMSFRLTPDYFNACDVSEAVGVPNSAFAQNVPALHGNAYAGFGRNHYNDFSEVLASELSSTLAVGTSYYVSFYVIRVRYGFNDCWNNLISAKFSTVAYEDWPENQTMPIVNSSHVAHFDMIQDTISWTKVEGYFVADSAYSFVSFGYQFDDDSLEVECFEQEAIVQQSYYFIDCICVTDNPDTCPDCNVLTSAGIEHASGDIFSVYPNPFTNEIHVSSFENDLLFNIHIITIDGKVIEQRKVEKSTHEIIDLSRLQKGLYVLRLSFKNGKSISYRIIKTE